MIKKTLLSSKGFSIAILLVAGSAVTFIVADSAQAQIGGGRG